MSTVRIAVILFILTGLPGCALNEKNYWAVNDPDMYWNRSGYSIKAPSGRNWYKQPTSDNYPNSIVFFRGEGVYYGGDPGKWIYMSGAAMVAAGTFLDEPVLDRKDKSILAATLRKHLDRYQRYWTTKIGDSRYDSSLGLDCLKYSGTPKIDRIPTNRGDIHEQEIKGYFCLHPDNDKFGVIMESRNISNAGSEPSRIDQQADHFFESLRFTPLSSAVSRTFKSITYQIGRSPSQMAFYQKKLWVALKDENRVVQVDPADGRIIASVPVGRQSGALSIGEKGVWVANSGEGTVTRIDPSSARIVQTIPVGGKPAAISAGGGYVWVADSSGNTVIRINPATNSVAATIAVGSEPVAVVAGKEGIWTANAGDGTVSLIDKAHDWTIATVKVGGRPVHLSLADTGVWVADEAGNAVVRINRTTREIVARIDVGGKPAWVRAFDGWDLFVALSDSATLVRIDPGLNRVFGPPIRGEASPRSMVYFAGSIWFANSAGTTLTAVNLDPTGRKVGSSPLP